MKEFSTILSALKKVFSKKLNIIIAGILSLVVFFSFILANSFALIKSGIVVSETFWVFFSLFLDQTLAILDIGGIINFLAVVLVSLLSGVTITMIIYQLKNFGDVKPKSGVVEIFGIFSGALAASCPACAVTLISLIGLSGGLAVLPFHGLEFSLLALVLLTFSLFMISKGLVEECEDCKINS